MCWQDEDEVRIIICDACEEEFHTYCLQPPLDDVPEGGEGGSFALQNPAMLLWG